MIVGVTMVVNVIMEALSLAQIDIIQVNYCSFSRSAMSLMFFAAAMAALLGVVTLARGLGTGTSGSLNRSHDSSIGHNC